MELEKAIDDITQGVASIQTKTDATARRMDDVERRLNARDFAGLELADGDVSTEKREHAQIFTEWLRNPRSHDVRARLENVERKLASGLSDAAGGTLVPELLVNRIVQQVKDSSPMRRLASVFAVSGGDVKLPVFKSDAESAWVGEGATRNATTEPTVLERKPTVGTSYALVSASEELMQDSAFDVTSWFVRTVGAELAKAEGIAFVSGNGSNRPTGFLNTAPESAGDEDSPARTDKALQYIATGAAGAFQGDYRASPPGDPTGCLVDALYALKSAYRANSTWIMSSATAAVVRKFRDADGRYLWSDALMAGQPPMLLGRPVELDENMPAIGSNTFPVALGDWRQAYGIFDVGGLRIGLEGPEYGTVGQYRWYIRRRTGGTILDSNAAKVIKAVAS